MEKAKKIKCYKRLIYKQFVQVSGLSTVSEFFAETFHAPLFSFVWRHHIGVQPRPQGFSLKNGWYSMSMWVLKLSSNEWSLLQILGDCSAGRSGEEGSRDNKSVFQSPSSSHLDLHFVLTAGFFKKGEYKEGKFHRHMPNVKFVISYKVSPSS